MLNNPHVAIVSLSNEEAIDYPAKAPYLPDKSYPELQNKVNVGQEKNIVFSLVRKIMTSLKMDIEHFSTPEWNPLSDLIKPGNKVLIKPNLVRHIHTKGGNFQAVITHGSLIRCILDYVALALKGKGEIIVGDAPLQSADFNKILEQTGLKEICQDVSKTWQIPVRIVDFRLLSVQINKEHRMLYRAEQQGDPAGYIVVNLGKHSLLDPIDNQYHKFRVTNYNCQEMRKHHNTKVHEYLIPRSVLEADVVINLPKLKTHRKAGLTAALKNLVGINGHKDWLPHHRCGSIKEGGDEYLHPSFLKRLQTILQEDIDKNPFSKLNFLRYFTIRILKKLIHIMAKDPYEEGSWYGNDTLWRTILDLNRLLIYADKKGIMREIPQRKYLVIVDAIIAGEGEGPMEPDARKCGFLVGGFNPVAIDAVLATLIGFDYRKIPLINNAFKIKKWPLTNFRPEDIKICSPDTRWSKLQVGVANKSSFNFTPPSGWKGYIELQHENITL